VKIPEVKDSPKIEDFRCTYFLPFLGLLQLTQPQATDRKSILLLGVQILTT